MWYNRGVSELEVRGVTPEEMIRELEAAVRRRVENKYAFQVGLREIEVEVDAGRAEELGVTMPFESVDQAEQGLRVGVIRPASFTEEDGTEHQVAIFDPEPVAYSGFADCVTHSLSLTDQGLFEVGRYPAVQLVEQQRYWQWFLHRRLATPDQVAIWQEESTLSARHVVDLFYEAMTGRAKPREEDSPFLFTLGETAQTRGAQGAIQQAGQHPMDFLTRHITGDWGNLGDFDRQQNEEALQIGLRLFSTYRLSTEQDVWVITEADRSATTLLLPEEY